ncbi:hypothetical protein CRE_10035 [Caenorhabditis remanei]|uniref:Ion transport domain-containing protein n=1 Tax=Caenorhabditis remanei TaxID=31234 RepID=E3M6X2_CAERE|nr:hypothetical protein CRE_10035 [Caenorhabditis remanei]
MSSVPFFSATPEPRIPPESIEMNDLSQGKSDPRLRIIEIISIYEEKYKMFSSMSMSDEKLIFHKIRETLSIGLSIEIESLFVNDYYSFSMILAAFYRQKYALNIPENKEEEKDFLGFCQHPLHTVMVMCYAAHSMQKMISKDDFGQTLKQEKYQLLKEQLEDLACEIVNNFNSSGPEGAIQIREALHADFKSEFPALERIMTPYEEYLYRKFDKSKEIMTVAYKAKAMKFLSQKPCLNLIRIRAECRKIDIGNCDGHEKRYKIRVQINKKEKLLVNTNMKLWFHAVFRGIYIGMFAYMLCKFPVYDDFEALDRTWTQLIPFFYVLTVLIAQVSMTFIKAIDYLNFNCFKSKVLPLESDESTQKKNCLLKILQWFRTRITLLHPYFKSNKLALWRICLVIPLLVLEAIRFILLTIERNKNRAPDVKMWFGGWVLVPIVLELLYCALFAIATVSSLRFFHFVQSLGFFVHLFKKMVSGRMVCKAVSINQFQWKTVGMFVLIFCTFWFVLAVIHVSISSKLSSIIHNSQIFDPGTFMSSRNTILYTVASQGKFEIFGEVQDEDRVGNISDCGHFNRTIFDFLDMDYMEASCLFRSSMLPFLVFTYIFVTGILLVNMLTAQLTKEYEKESENSRYYKGYLKYEQLAKIESKLYLPPPLSIIYVLIRILFALFTGICSIFNLIASRCCNRQCLFPNSSKFIWKSIIGNLEGYPWGAVRDSKDEHQTEEEIKNFLRKPPKPLWEKLKEMVNAYETFNVENLKLLKKKIDEFLDNETEEERERSQSRVGTDRDRREISMHRNLSFIRNQSSLARRIQSADDDPSAEASIPTFD